MAGTFVRGNRLRWMVYLLLGEGADAGSAFQSPTTKAKQKQIFLAKGYLMCVISGPAPDNCSRQTASDKRINPPTCVPDPLSEAYRRSTGTNHRGSKRHPPKLRHNPVPIHLPSQHSIGVLVSALEWCEVYSTDYSMHEHNICTRLSPPLHPTTPNCITRR